MNPRWRALGSLLARRSAAVIAVTVVVVAVLASGLVQLDFATGQDSFLEPGSRTAEDNERYQELFGGETMVVLFTMDEGRTVADLFTPSNVAQLEEIAEELSADPTFASVVTPLSTLQWTENLVTSGVATQILGRAAEREPDEEGLAARQESDLITISRVGAAGAPGFDNPDWIRFLLFDNENFALDDDGTLVPPAEEDLVIRPALQSFFPDPNHAVLAALVVGNASLDQLADATDAVEKALEGRTFENATIVVTGTPTFLTDINEYLQGGMLTLGAIALVVMVVVLLVVYSVRWRLLPLLVVLLGVAAAFGLVGYLGIDLSLVTISGLPILIGIGVDFAVQVHSRVEEECLVDRDRSPFAATLERLGPALLAASVAAVLSFLVMLISRVPMIRDFGVLLSIGMLLLLAVGIAVPISILGARERRSPTTIERHPRLVERLVLWLGSAPGLIAIPMLVLAAAVVVVGVIVEDDIPIESDPINWADQDSDSVVNARILEDEAGFATTLGVFVETEGFERNGVFTDQLAAFTHDFVMAELEQHDELVRASSLTSTVSYLIAVPGATPLPPLGEDLLAAYLVAPEPIQRLLVGEDGNAANVLFQVAPSSLEDRALVVDDIERSVADPGEGARLPDNASATTAGLAIVGVTLLDSLTDNRALYTLAPLALVALWLVLRFRSLPTALITMVPIAFATGAASILVAILDITISPMTTVGGPLIVAMCGWFSVLIVDRYLEERRDRGLEPPEATRIASMRTGRAFTTSALATVGGFGVLTFASLPLIRDFGWVVTVNIAVAVLSALVVLPPLLRAADRHGLVHAGPGQETPVVSRVPVTAAAAVVLAVLSIVALAIGLADEEDEPLAALTVPATDQPAETTTTTEPPPTTAPPETEPPPDGAPTTLPPGPPEPPTGLVATGVYGALVDAGADPGVARCTADTLLERTPEAELLALGIAQQPPSDEAAALVAAAATDCGVPPEVLATLAAG